jgi:hypothetical protein
LLCSLSGKAERVRVPKASGSGGGSTFGSGAGRILKSRK